MGYAPDLIWRLIIYNLVLKPYIPGGGRDNAKHGCSCTIWENVYHSLLFHSTQLASLNPPFVVEIKRRWDKASPFPDSREEGE